MIFGIFFSQSRGGIIGSLISLTLLIALSRRMQTRGMLLLVLGCWAVMLVYGSILGFDDILARFNQLDPGAEGRFQIWQTAWQIIGDHTWTGTGLGSFGELFRVYQSFLDDIMTTDFAHNDYLHLMVELGAPVAVFLFVLVWGYWWKVVLGIAAKTRGKRPEAGSQQSDSGFEQRRLIQVGALAGAAAFLCHSWVEFNWQIPANALFFVMLLVLMKVGDAKGEITARRIRRE
jgi:O-antigen ligase